MEAFLGVAEGEASSKKYAQFVIKLKTKACKQDINAWDQVQSCTFLVRDLLSFSARRSKVYLKTETSRPRLHA